jgi:hypothetical protein
VPVKSSSRLPPSATNGRRAHVEDFQRRRIVSVAVDLLENVVENRARAEAYFDGSQVEFSSIENP